MDQRIGGAQSPQWLFVSGQTALITKKRVCGPRADPPKIGEREREKQTNPRLTLDKNYYISFGEISGKYSWQAPHQHDEQSCKPGNSSGLRPGAG